LAENQALMKKYNVKSAAEANKKFLEMKTERRELRTRLDKFQKDFETANNRKIRYTKDIAPVANDFKRYKEMKSEISRLEVLVQALTTGSSAVQ
jgi:predicted nuclease with TOPRIM domain